MNDWYNDPDLQPPAFDDVVFDYIDWLSMNWSPSHWSAFLSNEFGFDTEEAESWIESWREFRNEN